MLVDLKVICNVGFCVVICNWLDGEGDDQLVFEEIVVVVCEFGMDVCYLLVECDCIGDVEVDVFGVLVDMLFKLVFVYCCSGSCFGMLWNWLFV